MQIINPSGTNISFENDPNRTVTNELRADTRELIFSRADWMGSN